MGLLLLASDFDGTLAPIRHDPESVRIDPRALDLLRRAQGVDQIAVALISGRDSDDLRSRAGGLDVWYSGSHGHEIVAPGGKRIRGAEPWSGSPPQAWLEEAGRAGIRLERKRFGVAAHWRGLPDVDADHPLIRRFEHWAEAEGLEIIRGRAVAEASVAGASKNQVLRWLAEHLDAKRILYAGDDLTDFAALTFAASRGRGFFVASPERKEQPEGEVERIEGLDALLAAFEEEIERARVAP
ncbi:MAG: trehalose-phosphatase [Thermoanaerobaculia bacterium]